MDSGISVYDFNKQIYGQMTPLTGDKLNAEIANITAWMGSRESFKYFMLNNYELKWFTIFNLGNQHKYKQAFDDLKEVISNIGTVLAIEYEHQMGYYEIWMRCHEDNDVHMFVLFDCNDLVIEVK